jgi:predicted TPR repeat methyltransferase
MPTRDPGAVQQKLLAGFKQHQHGDLDGALLCYRQVLAIAPDNPDALHLSGLVAHARGDHAKAIDLIAKATALLPGNPDMLANLSAVRLAAGDAPGALAASDQALGANARSAMAHAARGAALSALGRLNEAAVAYVAASEINPANPDPFNNLGNLEQKRGNLDAAIAYYEQALGKAPGNIQVHSNYGTALYTLARLGEAGAKQAEMRVRAWRQAHPDNPMARHWFAALTQSEAPARAGDDYVRNAFDMFAPAFETTLADLGYRAPQAIGEYLGAAVGLPSAQFSILDVGCGTGLAAPHLRPYASRLEGVDLSPAMLERAQARGLYDDLRDNEAVADMLAHPSEYDLAVAADVFVYFGDLAPLFAAAAACLRPQGRLVFTLEAMDANDARAAQGWGVEQSGRYAHTREHAIQCLEAAGFALETCVSQVFRREGGRALEGYLVAARRV